MLLRFGRCNYLEDYSNGCYIFRNCEIGDFLNCAQRLCGMAILVGGLCSSNSCVVLDSFGIYAEPVRVLLAIAALCEV